MADARRVAARERDDVEEDGKFARVDLESDEGVGGTSDEARAAPCACSQHLLEEPASSPRPAPPTDTTT